MKIKLLFPLAMGFFVFIACNQAQHTHQTGETNVQESGFILTPKKDTIWKIQKSPEDWKSELSELEYHVLREAGTERAFSGEYWDNKKKGTYVCRACDFELFDSKTKFKSGTGWPSFYKPLKKYSVAEKTDSKFGWNRVEILCAKCDGHLGHVFDDGPQPTGLRYCMNSVSLKFIEK